MGTNYFARIIPTKERKDKIKQAIDNNDFDEIRYLVNTTYSSPEYDYNGEGYVGGEIHLGKWSGGWKFLWNPNWYKLLKGHTEWEEFEGGRSGHWVDDGYDVFKYYDLTKKSIKEFIDREDVLIYDEYGELQEDKEEFFNMAVNWVTWKTPDGEETEAWDGVLYAKWQKENGEHYRKYTKTEYCTFLEELGYTMTEEYTDFFSDGLRFATNTCFS